MKELRAVHLELCVAINCPKSEKCLRAQADPFPFQPYSNFYSKQRLEKDNSLSCFVPLERGVQREVRKCLT